jgi:hypothetical protein
MVKQTQLTSKDAKTIEKQINATVKSGLKTIQKGAKSVASQKILKKVEEGKAKL